MRDALQPILRDRSWRFPPEDPEVVNGDSVAVPSVVGQDPATAIALLAASGFGARLAGERKESPLPPDRIAAQSPSGRAAPGQTIVLYLSSGPPAAQPGQPGEPGQPRPPGRRRGLPLPIPIPGPGG